MEVDFGFNTERNGEMLDYVIVTLVRALLEILCARQ